MARHMQDLIGRVAKVDHVALVQIAGQRGGGDAVGLGPEIRVG